MPSHSLYVNGIDIGSDYICIAQFSPVGNWVGNVIIKFFEEQGETAARNELRKLLREAKIHDEHAVGALGAESTIITTLYLDHDEPDTQTALQWELSQQIIGLPEEFVFDFQRTPDRDRPNEHAYLAVACRASAVSDLSHVLRSGKLDPQVVDLDLFALINLFEVNYPAIASSTPTLLVLGSQNSVKVVLTQNGMFIDYEPAIFSECTPDTVYGAVMSVNTKLQTINGLTAALPVYVAGPLFTQEEFVSRFCSAGQAQLINPFERISFKANMAESDLRKYAPHMAVAVGLAIRGRHND